MLIIVGGNGFIGRHLRNLLLAKGEDSVIISREPARARQWSAPGEMFVSASDFNGELGCELIGKARALIYLATTSTPATFADNPWKEVTQNVEPAAELFLKFATKNPKTKRILISSGGTIYGNSPKNLIDEDQEAAPISAYGLGKLMIEQALEFAGRTYGVNYNILRISNAIGRHHQSTAQGVVPAAIRCLQAGNPFNLIGDGSIVRDFVDADDVAEAIWSACNDQHFNDKIWNVGSSKGISVLEILSLVEKISGKKLNISHSPRRNLDVTRIVLNCERIASDIGWRARRDISKTIEDLWTFHLNLEASFTSQS